MTRAQSRKLVTLVAAVTLFAAASLAQGRSQERSQERPQEQSAGPYGLASAASDRAAERLQRLRGSLQRAAQERGVTLPEFSLLLVEPGRWSRYAPGPDGVSVAIDTDPPPAGSAVFITGEAVIGAILAGRVSAKDAFRRGLIAVDGPAPVRAEAKALMIAALSALVETR
jgi:hypothetical protein